MLQAPIRYTQTAKVGIYGRDDAGNSWSTFGLRGGKHEERFVACDICGKRIQDGYCGIMPDRQRVYVCPEHVVWTGKEQQP